jgi:hypothetical protein
VRNISSDEGDAAASKRGNEEHNQERVSAVEVVKSIHRQTLTDKPGINSLRR